jgi:hypothetical protein
MGPIWGFVFTLIILWKYGRDFEKGQGPLRLAAAYFGCGLVSGVVWLLLPSGFRGGEFAGAQAPLLALIALETFRNRDGEVLLAGVLPVQNRWVLALFTFLVLLPLADPTGWRAGAPRLDCLANGVGLLAPWIPLLWSPSGSRLPARGLRRRRPPSVTVNAKTVRNPPSENTPLATKPQMAALSASNDVSVEKDERVFLQNASQRLAQKTRKK